MSLLAALLLAASPPAQPCAAERHDAPHGALCEPHTQERRAKLAVQLDADFFQARGAGGVGRDPVMRAPRRRTVILAPAHPPRSAGVQAARRGLRRD